MQIQRGKYIAIENDVERIKKQIEIKNQRKKFQQQNISLKSVRQHEDELQLNLRFCLESEVGRKRNKFLNFKSQFMVKM